MSKDGIVAKFQKINPYVTDIYWDGTELVLIGLHGITFTQKDFANESPTWMLFEEAKDLIGEIEE